MITSDEAFDIIEQIASKSGHAKRKLLSNDLRPYLQAAYNPYKRYYQTSASVPKICGTGKEMFDNTTWLLLDKLHSRELSGAEAIATIHAAVQFMTYKSAELFKRILNKDLRMGVGPKTINKVLPNCIPTHDIMLAKTFDENKIKFPCWGTPKIDGVRSVFKFGEFYSRNGHIYNGLDHLKEVLAKFKKTHLDFELTVPGHSFQEASGMIRSDSPTPGAIATLLEIPNLKKDYFKRIKYMMTFEHNIPYVTAMTHHTLSNLDQVYRYYSVCRKLGYEGAVLRSYDYEYTGTRSIHWMKMKEVNDIDLRVIDIFEGTGKYTGMLGGVVVDFNGTEVKVGSGFSDADRMLFWEQPDFILGKIIEIQYMELTDGDKSLRHPRFICIRYDK